MDLVSNSIEGSHEAVVAEESIKKPEQFSSYTSTCIAFMVPSRWMARMNTVGTLACSQFICVKLLLDSQLAYKGMLYKEIQ